MESMGLYGMGAMRLVGGAAGGAWRARALDLLRVARGLAAACTLGPVYISTAVCDGR
jgi:hypothetical protein